MTSDGADRQSAMAWRLEASDFELFDVPARFALDRATLDARWRASMARVHPDRFAAGSAAEQCAAMQWAIRFNQAYDRLKTPLSRAAYLCELNGHRVDAETSTAMAPAFLVQVMEWREALDRARGPGAIQALADEASACRLGLLDDLAALIDLSHDWTAAAATVRALMFVARFEQEIERRADSAARLDD